MPAARGYRSGDEPAGRTIAPARGRAPAPPPRVASMTYELLKRLKDSGFPLRRVAVEAGREITLERTAVVFSLSASAAEVGIYYAPSVSDLVQACGDHLRNMFRV